MHLLRRLGRQLRYFWLCSARKRHTLFRKARNWNARVHQRLHTNHPTLAKIVGVFLRFFWNASTHPAFAVLLALLLVGFVISGAITIIVSVSVYVAWLITVLWLAHSAPIKAISVLPRLILVLVFAFCTAFGANWYVHWCLRTYAKNQPIPAQNLDGQQIKEIFDQEIKSLPPPSVAPSEHTLAQPKTRKVPVVRIVELALRPIEAGKPLILDVRYVNDRDETVTVIGHYAQEWVDNLPDDMDIAGNTQLENGVWDRVAELMRDGPKLTLDIPPKVEITSSLDQNTIAMTDELIKRLDDNSGIYIAGVLEDPSGRFSPTAYCVRVDKKRTAHGISLCRSMNLPKQQ